MNKFHYLSLNDATESSTLETDGYVWRYVLLVVHAENDKDLSVCFFVIQDKVCIN